MSGWYEVARNDHGEYWFVLKADGQGIVLRSEQYASMQTVLSGIASVRRNAPLGDRYQERVARDGRHYFNLRAANHRVIGTSLLHATESGRALAMAAVKAHGSTTDVRAV